MANVANGQENQLMLRADYEVDGNKISLSPGIVRKFIAVGGNITDEEVGVFIQLCKAQKLNPFTREVYLMKYGKQATTVTGKETFVKRAERNPHYKGFEAGVIVINFKNELERRSGSFYMKSKEELVGGWAKVYRNDKAIPLENEVSFEEYKGRDGSLWDTKPATMIRKVALVQALREAFPEDLNGLYSAEEFGEDYSNIDDKPINIQAEKEKSNRVEQIPVMADKKQKAYIMELAKAKGLANGKDIEKLEEFTSNNGMNIRSLTSEEAEMLMVMLEKYQDIQDVEFTPVDTDEVNEEDKVFEE